MKTEIALTTVLEDCTNPAFASFKSSMQTRTQRILGYNPRIKNDTLEIIGNWIENVMDRKVHPREAYEALLKLQRSTDSTTAKANPDSSNTLN